MAGSDTRLARAGGAPRDAGFRPDIEGLRAVAIGLVLLYHAGLPFVPSGFVGVDVFFVISGFLITGLLIREVERTGRVSLRQFYARRAKRLLPATALVLVVTAFLTWLVLPVTQWRDFGGDVVAAALYLVNWRFAERSVDYLAEGIGPSPVLHFWSLAVEEQFYIVWPLLLVAVTLVLRRWPGARVRPVMAAALVLVAVPTFVWSIHLTSTSPATAFFVTTTRLWELAVGAFVAIGTVLWRRLPARLAAPLAVAGLVAIGASGVVFADEVAWPGAGALLPTLGTAAVIVAGTANGSAWPARLLGVRPMVAIGALSYSLYLWHWPLLVAAGGAWGELSSLQGLAVVLASFVPAALSLRFVENPIRFSPSVARSPRLALSLGGNFSLIGVVAGLALVLAVPLTASAPGEAAGAEAVDEDTAGDHDPDEVDSVEWMVPDPVAAPDDVPVSYEEGCQTPGDSAEVAVCEYGEPDGAVTLALVGDSKALQWQPALDRIARDQGWRLLTFTKSACEFAEPSGAEDSVEGRTCVEWNDRVLAMLLADPPDAVLTSHGVGRDLDPDEVDSRAGRLAERWRTLDGAGIAVLPLLDNPNPEDEVYECVAENRERLSACAFERADAIGRSGAPEQRRATEMARVSGIIDLTDTVCPGDRCAPVIGNVLVYRQGSHLTRTFVETATDALAEQLVPAVVAATEGD